jgi:ligand-binding SRPBCC domain-containing protein
MTVQVLERQQLVRHPVGRVFGFFARARNLELLTPPWLRFEVLTPEPVEMRVGTVIDYRLRLHGLPLRWQSRIEAWEPERAFVDRQLRGPYKLWHHRHEFEPCGADTLVRDRVHYALPFGALGAVVARSFVARDLDRIFAFRHEAVRTVLG